MKKTMGHGLAPHNRGLIESVERIRKFRATLSWPCPDRVALSRLPDPLHQTLREHLLLSLH